jgi:tetratricopeptide (TPR) repeat protein
MLLAIDTSAQKERARLAVERRNYPYAIELYQEILQLEPNDVDARRSLRAVEIRQAKETGTSRTSAILKNLGTYIKLSLPSKNYEGVIMACEKYLQSDPTNPRVLKKLATAAYAAGYRETAVAVLDDLRQQQPDDIEGLRMLMAAYREVGDTQKALEVCRDIIKMAPEDREASQAQRDLSASDMSRKFETAAISGQQGSTSQDIVKNKEEIERLSRDRENLRTEEDVKAEIEATKGDIKAKPEDSRLRVKIGNMYLRLREFDAADEAFQKAKELSPTEYTIEMKLQDVVIGRMRVDASKLAKAWQENRNDAKTKAAYREAYTKLLRYRLKCFEERERQFPTDLNIAFGLGNLYFESKNLDEAIKRYQRTVHDPKNRAKSLLNLGISFQRKNQFDLAIKQFSEGIQHLEVWNVQKMELVYQRADCYEQMGSKDEATSDFTAIYEKDIAFKDIGERLAKLQKG